jgi:hypothetical protein
MGDVEGHLVLLELFGDVEHGTGFEQGALDTVIGEDTDRRSAAGAGTDHDDVENFGATLYLWHPNILAPNGFRRVAGSKKGDLAFVGSGGGTASEHRSGVIPGSANQFDEPAVGVVDLQKQLAAFASAANAALTVHGIEARMAFATALKANCSNVDHGLRYRIIFLE